MKLCQTLSTQKDIEMAFFFQKLSAPILDGVVLTFISLPPDGTTKSIQFNS